MNMERILPLFLDLAAVLFVIGYIRSAARRGFVRTAVQLIGFFISLFLANTLSSVVAEYTFTNFIQQGLTDKISEQIASSGSADGFLQTLAAVLESIPSYLLNALEFAGLPADLTLPSALNSVEQLAADIVEQTIGPTCIALFSTIFFLLFFSLFMFLTRTSPLLYRASACSDCGSSQFSFGRLCRCDRRSAVSVFDRCRCKPHLGAVW